jgi:hypothetical protein
MSDNNIIDRRRFIQNSSALLGIGSLNQRSGSAAQGQQPSGSAHTVSILSEPAEPATFLERLAANELVRGLGKLGIRVESPQGGRNTDLTFVLNVRKDQFKNAEAYEIRREGKRVRLTAASPQALLYSVSDLLERQGVFFGLDGEIYPLEAPRSLELPPEGPAWMGQPSFSTRGLLPFPDFLNCISVYNREEYRAVLEAMARMRMNTLFTYCHSGGNQAHRVWNNESYLSFEYGGVGHWSALQTTATFFQRWGYLAQRTSQYGMGAPDFFAGDVFGSDAALGARNIWEEQQRTQKMQAEAFRYAHKLGIRTVVGFEVYSIPEEIIRVVPPEARLTKKDPNIPLPPIDPESVASKDILEARLARLLEAYPDVDYVSLWQDEAMNFATRNNKLPFSVTPFKQAHDFLRRHAPKVRMVLSGWGGVVRNFDEFHKRLPGDVIFSALTDNLGWDPVNPEYAQLESRERWPIPWVEDDGSMWWPQLLVHRWRKDMNLARQYGCQGMVGIHWRTRILDANLGLLSRNSWQESLKPEELYDAYAKALVRSPRAAKLSAVLNEADRDRLLLDSMDNVEVTPGRAKWHPYSADYNEGFQGWKYEPQERIKASQVRIAKELRALTDSATSPVERERLNYIARQVEFLVPYTESWNAAYKLREVLDNAEKLKKDGKPEDAKALVREQGVPLWIKMAAPVREALLDFQEIVSTWNDVGTVASLHNKYERVAMFRLPASMKEYLLELPAEMQAEIEKTRKPDPNAPVRVFIPTRPTVLAKGERVRVLAIVQGGQRAAAPVLFTRISGATAWSQQPMKLLGRRTYAADLAPEGKAPFLEYYVSAQVQTAKGVAGVSDPPEAPSRAYGLTLSAV